MPPTLIFIRHAQALHNVNQDYSIPDPDLSNLGKQQCLELRDHLRAHMPEDLEVGLIVVSPMRRTIRTALLGLDWLLQDGIPMEANASWQENSGKPCDTGSPRSVLEDEFREYVDFSHLDPVYPDKTSAAGARYHYTKKAIIERAQFALFQLYNRPENCIVVVSHSGFLRQGVTGKSFANADYRILDFEPITAPGNLYSLIQRDITRTGGMSWSAEDQTQIGTGLPEDQAA